MTRLDVSPQRTASDQAFGIGAVKGYSRDLAERSLAHTIKDKVEAAYHRTDLLEQRRELMDAWERLMGKLGNVESQIQK